MPKGIYKRTKEHNENIRKAMKGRICSQKTKEKISTIHLGIKDKPMTEETKEKIRQANLGKKQSQETIEKKRKNTIGKKRTEKQCDRISKSLIGHKVSKKTRLKLSKINRKYKHTKEAKEKISKASAERMMKVGYHKNSFYYQGHFYSNKNKKDVFYRSSIELGYYTALELLDCIIRYEVNCLMIQYQYLGKLKHYVPDVLVYLKDGTKQLIEIKHTNEIKTKINQAKFKAAKKHCKENSLDFRIWTEKGFIN